VSWLFLAVLFLALTVFALLVAIRTRADEGLGAGWWEHHVGEGETASRAAPESVAEGIPAAFYTAYPSPFRPLPEGPEGEEGSTPITTPETEPDEVSQPSRDGDELVYHSRRNDRMEIALSFDDGPHPRLTPVILDILAEYGVKATFFMVGENVGYYPAAARAVAEAGHEIGNHTFSHRRFGRMSEDDLLHEIHACEEAIASVTNAPIRWIRPPEGQLSEVMGEVLGDSDYRVILWDVDTRDWAHTPPSEITRHILDTVQAGDIILMHDFIGHDSPTPAALRQVIPALLERGYRFVTVGELVEDMG
jgi:peptidoglycan/xylan/chitin deacetylase (PgdA/CDA1 family)